VPVIDRILNRRARAEFCAALLACLACVNGVSAQAEPAPVEPSAPAVGSDTAPAPAAKPAEPPPSAAAPTAPAEPAPAPPPPPPPPIGPPPAPGSFAEKVVYEPPKDDVTTLTASGGGALNGGNTNSYAVNVGANFQLIRQPHGFSAYAAFAYGVADLPDDDSDNLEPIVRNLNARARYDFFMSRMDALFLATVFRWDPFAGIDRRNQGQIGYLRYFLREDKHRFWGEVGYDLTADNYGPVEGKPDAVLPVDENVLVHSARLFAGYDNQLNAALTYVGGLEALFNVEESKDVRLNFSNALRSAIAGNFSLELKLTLAFDNVPATTDAKKLDTTLLVNLLYQLI
jgi:putative salt-induced outer membrane protein YdiY